LIEHELFGNLLHAFSALRSEIGEQAQVQPD
jgi:hypothetical protein